MNSTRQNRAVLAAAVTLLILTTFFLGFILGRRTDAPTVGGVVLVPASATSPVTQAPAIAATAPDAIPELSPPGVRPEVSFTDVVPKVALELEIAPTSQVFFDADFLKLKVSFINHGTGALCLPNNARFYGDWLIRLESVSTGKVLTGSAYYDNRAQATMVASQPLPAGGSFNFVAGFQKPQFTFVEGAFASKADFYTAVHAAGGPPARGPQPKPEFPEGVYKVTLTALFPNSIDAAKAEAAIWKFDAVESNTVQVAFRTFTPQDAGTISGVVTGPTGAPAPGALVEYRRLDPDFPPASPGTHAGEADAQKSAFPVTPSMPSPLIGRAGRTDQNGVFDIPNLTPGNYLVTAFVTTQIATQNRQDWEGSRQPIEVRSATVTKLDGPLQAAKERIIRRGGTAAGP